MSIADLEMRLSKLAVEYRSLQEHEERFRDVVAEYAQVIVQLCNEDGWSGEPSPDSQLSPEHMPDAYRENLKRVLNATS